MIKDGEETGTGKRSTLFHVLHHCYKAGDWLLVHLPGASNVLRNAKESTQSQYKENRLDTPIEAMIFLKRFTTQNEKLLNTLNVSLKR